MAPFKPPMAHRNPTNSLWELLNLGDLDATAWMVDALCAQTDPDAFYPEFGQDFRPAKGICMGCPVREQCLSTALDNGEVHGIWGGTSPQERKRLRRQHVIDAAAAGGAESGVAA